MEKNHQKDLERIMLKLKKLGSPGNLGVHPPVLVSHETPADREKRERQEEIAAQYDPLRRR